MAWTDIFKDFLPENTNIFGASLPTYVNKAKEVGLLDQTAIDKANRQSLFQGLLGTAAAYFAQPKNQGYGSALPYIAKAYGQGMQMAQNPYTQLGKEMQYAKEFEEYGRQQKVRDLQKKLYAPMTVTGEIVPQAQANVSSAPIDASNPLGMQIAPDFTPVKTRQYSTTTNRIDPRVMEQIMGIDLGAGANVLAIDENLRKRESREKSVNAVENFIEKYGEDKFGYLRDQDIDESIKFVNQALSPTAFKTIGSNKIMNVITGETRTVPLEGLIGDKGTFQKTGFAIDPNTGDSYDIVFDTRTGKNTVTIGGKEVDLDTVQFNGKRPFIKTIGDMDKEQLDSGSMIKLSNELITQENSVRNLAKFLERNNQITTTGIPKWLQMIEKDMKQIFQQNPNLTVEQFNTALQQGELQKLVGQQRLNIVGPGALTEQEAARIMLALGGDPSSVMRNPLVSQALVSNILADAYSNYQQTWSNYNLQTTATANKIYGVKDKIELSKSQIASIAPDVAIERGFAKLPDLSNQQLAILYKYKRPEFMEYMKSSDVSDTDRARIWKFIMGK